MPSRMYRVVLAGALLAALLSVPVLAAPPTVQIDLAEGARVSDVVVVTAKAVAGEDTAIARVEFLIDDQARGTDTSIPYTLTWDTLDDKEGRHTITAVATTEGGESARASVGVVVDNELSKGAAHHAREAEQALKDGDSDRAVSYARRAIKIEAGNIAAARVIAAVHRARNEVDKAIAVLEQAAIPAGDVRTRSDLAALYVLRGEAGQTTDSLLAGATAGYEQRSRAVAEWRESLTKSDTPAVRGDAAYAQRKWAEAAREYQTAGDVETATAGSLNRLLLAYARADKRREFDVLLRNMTRGQRVDDVTRAVEGYYLLMTHKPEQARTALQPAVENRVLPALVVAAFTEMVLGQKKQAADLAEIAFAMAPERPEVQFLQSYLTPGPIDAHRQLVAAMAGDPTAPEPYVRHAYLLMTGNEAGKYEKAEKVLEFARKLDPAGPDALMATAALFMVQRRPQEAQPMIEQLLAVDKDAPDGLVAQALNFSVLEKEQTITALLDKASKIDQTRWNDGFVPKPQEFLSRVIRYRLSPIMTPDLLYPTPD